jgi:cytochrome b
MENVIIVTENGKFVEVLDANTDIKEWVHYWLIRTRRDDDINYHEGGAIMYSELWSRVIISGADGVIELNLLFTKPK